METSKEIKVIILVHTPMQLVSGFSLLTQLGFDKRQVFVGLVTRKNKEVVSFMKQVLTVDEISHAEVFNIDGFLSSRFFVFDYFQIYFKFLRIIKAINTKEVYLLPDRAHPFYRFVAILFVDFLQIKQRIVFFEEGASHYYSNFQKSYISKYDFIGKIISRRFLEYYKEKRILHYSIKKLSAFKYDENHQFYLYPFKYLIQLSKKFQEQYLLEASEEVVFLIPTSLKYFEGIDLTKTLYNLWFEKLAKYNLKAKTFIKPHPLMDNHHLDEICVFFEKVGKKIEATSNDYRYIPVEYLFQELPINSLLLGYDSSSIYIFGPQIYGSTFTFINFVNEIFENDYNESLSSGIVKSDYYLSSMNLMKSLEENGF